MEKGKQAESTTTTDKPNPPPAKRQRAFRLQGKGFYLTFPQSGDVTKEQVLSRLTDKFGEHLEWAVVGAEKHTTGDPHLHIAFKCKEPQGTRA